MTQYPWGNRRSGLREWLFGPRKPKPTPPTCADTGTPKWPGNCWNVRCQLGHTCCRASVVDKTSPTSIPKDQSMTASVNLLQHLNLLGMRVEDRVTGFKGVCASVTFDLYGCIQGIVNPGIGADGKLLESNWFDVNRLRVLDETPVMERPRFEWTPAALSAGEKGPAERPRSMKA